MENSENHKKVFVLNCLYFVLVQTLGKNNTAGPLLTVIHVIFPYGNTKPLFFILCVQSHQNEVEIFDENLAHISTWLYQTQIHLDETERLAPSEREKVVKVRQRGSL